MGIFSNLFRSAKTVQSEMGTSISSLMADREAMQALPDDALFDVIRTARLHKAGSAQTTKALVAEQVLKGRGHSRQQIKQETRG